MKPLDNITGILNGAQDEYPKTQRPSSELYFFGQGSEKSMEEAILLQEEYVEHACRNYRQNRDIKSYVMYLHSETDLAVYELEDKRLRECRNTCWRVIKETKYGENEAFGDNCRQISMFFYVRIYVILGDMFRARKDPRQSRECYEKALIMLKKEDASILEHDILLWFAAACQRLGDIITVRPFRDQHSAFPYYVEAKDLLEICMSQGCNNLSEYEYGKCLSKVAELGDRLHKIPESEVLEYYGMAEKILFAICHNIPTSKTISELSRMILSMTDYYLRIGKGIDVENSLLQCLDIIETCDCFETTSKKDRKICECRLRLGEIYAAEGHTDASDTIREAVSLARTIFEKKGTNKNKSLLARALLALYHSGDKTVARETFSLYRELSNSNHNYIDIFFDIKRELWKDQVLSETDFPTCVYYTFYDKTMDLYHMIEEHIMDLYKERGWRYVNYHYRNCVLHHPIIIYSDEASNKHIEKIVVCPDAFQEHEDYSVFYLCECGAVSTRNNPTPDEFVYVTYKEDRLAGKMESHKYQFAYG